MKRKMAERLMRRSPREYVIVGCVLHLLALSSTAHAQVPSQHGSSGAQQPVQFDYGLSLGAGYSDNIQRTSSDERGETYASAGLNLVFKDDSRTLYSDSQVDVAYLNYLHNTFGDEVVGNANINLDARLVPGTFEWILADSFGQVRPHPDAPVSPDNRENVNYVTTGPRFTVHLTPTNRAQLGGHYSKITYQSSSADNDRYGGDAALIHDFSAVSNVSLNVTSERTKYAADSIGTDYNTNSAYLGFTLVGSRTRLTLDFGYTQVKLSGDKSGGALARIQLERQLTPSTYLTLRGGRELTNSGDVFRGDQSVQAITLNTQLATAATDTLVRKYAGAGWNFMKARTGFGVNVDWSKEEHQQQVALNRKATTATTFLSRQITPALRAQLSASYTKENFDVAQANSRDLSETFGIDWRIGKQLTTSMQLQHYSRDSDVPNGNYGENRVWVQFIYGTARAW